MTGVVRRQYSTTSPYIENNKRKIEVVLPLEQDLLDEIS